ncbi:hypothetical protein GFH48_19910 [Streptomyces fagopyri]|uniref:Uncharacterized protein n=1 Tax=Streptomyces fagopyri TaxID=2662397 RepID=A0A5Q0LFB4_9ACTN|nr:hypothetical protein [Streptomyces fagopyri]QFZ75227.1 hypothetical protein GFH48_19910 [Streptomyces fagopyri]
MSRHRRSADMPAGAERLREVFADAACDVAASPVPLAAVERAARQRGRRRAAIVLGSACALLVVPAVAVALRAGVGAGADATRSTGLSAGPRGSVRVVAPGERVRVASGVKIWLTEDGGHWTSPGNAAPRFRGVRAAGTDLGTPGVTVQEERAGDYGYFVSGVYHGRGDAARVRIETAAGDVDGTALTLAGSPHWGVWYALVKPTDPTDPMKPIRPIRPIRPTNAPEPPAPAEKPRAWKVSEMPEAQGMRGTLAKRRFSDGLTKRVTVYDSAGKVIATMEYAT